MIRSVLVPLDGSAFGEHALPLALAIARRAGTGVQLIHVHPRFAVAFGENLPVYDETLDAALKARQLVYLDNVVSRVAAVSPVHVKPVLLEGETVPTIRALATSTGVDLVVMTTHARGALGRFWLGSVADELVRDLPIPLLLVHPGASAPDLSAEPVWKRMLVPLDGTALAEQILEPAVALGTLLGAEYTLLRVIRSVLPMPFGLEGSSFGEQAQALMDRIDNLQQQLGKEALEYLDGVAGRLRQRGLQVQTRVVSGEQPGVAILHEAVPPAADVIALETHGRRGLSRLFLGSVADKVIRGSTVPVLVQRPVFP